MTATLDFAAGTLVDDWDLPFELRSLTGAKNYQGWVFDTIQPYLGKRILELGAGIGNMSQWLPVAERLILTEVEPKLLKILEAQTLRTRPDPRVTVRSFSTETDALEPLIAENLDTVVSFNVLEHIEDDEAALRALVRILRESAAPGPKRLITFVPAHQWAYGSMDRAFGHHRRYSYARARELARKICPEARFEGRYFNAFGLAGWFLNGRLLKKEVIGEGSIRAFERLCPWLRGVDDWMHTTLRLPVGQSLLFVLTWDR
jgi:SAM-dependent methyltransferase